MLHLSKPKKQACKQQLDLEKTDFTFINFFEGCGGRRVCTHAAVPLWKSEDTRQELGAFHYLSPRNGTHSVLVLVAGTFIFLVYLISSSNWTSHSSVKGRLNTH